MAHALPPSGFGLQTKQAHLLGQGAHVAEGHAVLHGSCALHVQRLALASSLALHLRSTHASCCLCPCAASAVQPDGAGVRCTREATQREASSIQPHSGVPGHAQRSPRRACADGAAEQLQAWARTKVTTGMPVGQPTCQLQRKPWPSAPCPKPQAGKGSGERSSAAACGSCWLPASRLAG